MMGAALTALLKTYDVGRLLWEAKGWPMDGVAAQLAADEELRIALAKEKLKVDLSQAALSRRSLAGAELPRAVAEAIERLETRPRREHLTEIVITGLHVLQGESTTREPREVALALLAHFPTDEFALKFAEAIANRAGLAPSASLLDSLGRAIADRLPHVLKLRETKLARRLGKYLDRLTPKRIALAGAAGGVGGAVVACVVLGVAGGMLLSGRLHLVHPEAAKTAQVAPAPTAPTETDAPMFVDGPQSPEVPANITQRPMIFVQVTQGSAPFVFDAQSLLGAIAAAQTGDNTMGPKPIDNPTPSKPLPLQKAPPCLKEAGEREIGGGCWVYIADVKPPCGRYLFRSGDACYRPVAADPTKPVGLLPKPRDRKLEHRMHPN